MSTTSIHTRPGTPIAELASTSDPEKTQRLSPSSAQKLKEVAKTSFTQRECDLKSIPARSPNKLGECRYCVTRKSLPASSTPVTFRFLRQLIEQLPELTYLFSNEKDSLLNLTDPTSASLLWVHCNTERLACLYEQTIIKRCQPKDLAPLYNVTRLLQSLIALTLARYTKSEEDVSEKRIFQENENLEKMGGEALQIISKRIFRQKDYIFLLRKLKFPQQEQEIKHSAEKDSLTELFTGYEKACEVLEQSIGNHPMRDQRKSFENMLNNVVKGTIEMRRDSTRRVFMRTEVSKGERETIKKLMRQQPIQLKKTDVPFSCCTINEPASYHTKKTNQDSYFQTSNPYSTISGVFDGHAEDGRFASRGGAAYVSLNFYKILQKNKGDASETIHFIFHAASECLSNLSRNNGGTAAALTYTRFYQKDISSPVQALSYVATVGDCEVRKYDHILKSIDRNVTKDWLSSKDHRRGEGRVVYVPENGAPSDPKAYRALNQKLEPQLNLSRALGDSAFLVISHKPKVGFMLLGPGDYLGISSDGFDYLPSDEEEFILRENPDVMTIGRRWLQALDSANIDELTGDGSKLADDATLILMRVGRPSQQPV